MFKNVSDHFGSILVALLSMQTVCSALAVETIQTNEKESSELAVRTSDEYTIVHKWEGGAIIGAASSVGLVITGIANVITSWYSSKPDAQKVCGKSATIQKTGDDGVGYKYYVYSYTTGSNCDSTQRAKTITKKLSDAFDDLHSQGASAVCLDFDHHGTWHGVIGLATVGSGIDPQSACSDHHAGAKRSDAGFLELEEDRSAVLELDEDKETAKRNEIGIVKRTSISVSESNKKSGSTKFSNSNKSQAVILGIANQMYQKSQAGSCSSVTGTIEDYNGVSYSYYFYASGRNCDTTAEIKTMVTALDDAWDGLGSTSALCMTMQHGSGTWRGHLGISAMQGTYPASSLC
ncbi:uncharacterized protein N7511_010476 [Penicillium nucicola]|uniref:uncharacterized protein n=1 Tax=Penicillium nucicola TaxID=1850975 RepID=UPI002544FEF2|nr:uncharacterized protein N7511_010476 [Penicillium nucicola]KAJ5748780.1 hypothetical protein N7511_010476 [Penicillium nucicola]